MYFLASDVETNHLLLNLDLYIMYLRTYQLIYRYYELYGMILL